MADSWTERTRDCKSRASSRDRVQVKRPEVQGRKRPITYCIDDKVTQVLLCPQYVGLSGLCHLEQRPYSPQLLHLPALQAHPHCYPSPSGSLQYVAGSDCRLQRRACKQQRRKMQRKPLCAQYQISYNPASPSWCQIHRALINDHSGTQLVPKTKALRKIVSFLIFQP